MKKAIIILVAAAAIGCGQNPVTPPPESGPSYTTLYRIDFPAPVYDISDSLLYVSATPIFGDTVAVCDTMRWMVSVISGTDTTTVIVQPTIKNHSWTQKLIINMDSRLETKIYYKYLLGRWYEVAASNNSPIYYQP